MLSFVVAVSDNNVIGTNNTLPWNLKEELQNFKKITLNGTKTIIMGRKTFESLPKILPGRYHIILTKNKNYKIQDKNVKVFHNIDKLKSFIESNKEYFVIGGGQIFKYLMPYASKIYMTLIHSNFNGDTFFPKYDKDKWKIVERSNIIKDRDSNIKYTFLTLYKNTKYK